jgi:hypothetical protein
MADADANVNIVAATNRIRSRMATSIGSIGAGASGDPSLVRAPLAGSPSLTDCRRSQSHDHQRTNLPQKPAGKV